VSRRPIAALVAGVAFIPGAAHAAGPSSAGGVKGSTASSVFKGARTFSSPASTSFKVQKATTATPHAAAATGTVIYPTDSTCTSETGRNGTSAEPYCDVQYAVNAALAGDTVDLQAGNGAGLGANESVTVSTSNISIVGTGT
jgi:hypothetical protein